MSHAFLSDLKLFLSYKSLEDHGYAGETTEYASMEEAEKAMAEEDKKSGVEAVFVKMVYGDPGKFAWLLSKDIAVTSSSTFKMKRSGDSLAFFVPEGASFADHFKQIVEFIDSQSDVPKLKHTQIAEYLRGLSHHNDDVKQFLNTWDIAMSLGKEIDSLADDELTESVVNKLNDICAMKPYICTPALREGIGIERIIKFELDMKHVGFANMAKVTYEFSDKFAHLSQVMLA